MALTRAELGRAIRELMRASRSATLSTCLARDGTDADGWPYGSLVTVAIDQDGSPLLLFTDLADHARNLKTDTRASLLFEQTSRRQNPQRGPRVSILGNIRKTRKPEHAARFFAMHPEAEMYAGFGDFHFYRMTVTRAHWVGGFAKAQWLLAKHVLGDAKPAKTLAAAAADIIEHMNTDHAEAVDLYAQRLLKRQGHGWRMVGIDMDGTDLSLDGRFARLAFPNAVHNAGEARDILVSLAGQARTAAASS